MLLCLSLPILSILLLSIDCLLRCCIVTFFPRFTGGKFIFGCHGNYYAQQCYSRRLCPARVGYHRGAVAFLREDV